jgi:LemA protein
MFASRTVSRFTVIALTALALTQLAGCAKYDELIEKDERAQAQWADYDAQLQRRHDLVPSLVATVKGAAAQEQQTLTKVMEARAKATSINLSVDDLQNPEKVAALQKAEGELSGSLSRLLAVQENYPNLKSNQNFADLMVSLEGTENRILRARQQYNEAARDYNTTLRKLSGAAVKRATGGTFQPRVYLTTAEDAKAAPTVTF